ncbi:MAG: galactose-1-phosphate uridylyltransferase [Nitrospiraceae bacterium]|nr:MAG: galactose-1-phosphate uridylyltransferase [Nitrospiraceae bacterium]
MSELRQDPTTYDWVIIAKERAKRPHEFMKHEPTASSLLSYSKECPFCPGNEDRTPGATAVYGPPEKWEIRVVPNKYSALTPGGDTQREEWKLFRKIQGYGMHEVVIETPLHNVCIPFMDDSHVEKLIAVYRDRYNELKKDPNIKVIIIFKNHGRAAGTSLEHPHTQIVASPIVPPFIRRRYEIATQHFDNTGHCLYCDILYNEFEAGERIIMDNKFFVALHPFASHYPFETWIMPKVHSSSFGKITDIEITDLARLLKEILLKQHVSLDNPDYNLIIHTSPVDDEHKTYYLWHIQIIPRLTLAAGFELGSGIYINTAVPEETAAFMREFRLKEQSTA